MKWCSGLCGRELPPEAFEVCCYRNRQGEPTPYPHLRGDCRACRRVAAKERFRKKYHASGRFRRKECARSRTRYRTDAAYAERKRARDRDYNQTRRKLRACGVAA